MIMVNAGLVLEGGGMKGIYTSGVLDLFLDKGLEFSNVYGVSAGACNMVSYLAGQKGRGRDVMVDYLSDKRYMGIYSLLTTGDIFNADTNYNLVPNYLNPLDYAKIDSFPGKAFAVATNIETGEAEYLRITDMEHQVDYIRASSSLPLVSRNVKIDGKRYLDGGLADSIPIRKSISDGNEKNVIVMTKPVGFRRNPEKTLALIKVKYIRYPKVYELLKNRHTAYNEIMDFLEKEEAEGSIFVIRPQQDLEISRLERDEDKLNALYEEGYKEAESRYEELIQYLNK